MSEIAECGEERVGLKEVCREEGEDGEGGYRNLLESINDTAARIPLVTVTLPVCRHSQDVRPTSEIRCEKVLKKKKN